MHVDQNITNALGPLDDHIERKTFIAVAFHQLEEILPIDVFHHKLDGLPLLDKVKYAWHDRHVGHRTQNLGLALKEIKPDGKFLLLGADHVLDGHRPALLHIRGQVNGSEPANGEQFLDAVALVQNRACCDGQRRAATLADGDTGRIGDAADRIGTEIGRSIGIEFCLLLLLEK